MIDLCCSAYELNLRRSLTKKTTPSFSKHFRFERLTDGVYAAIHIDGGWGICNAGIVDLGDLTLVFDTGLTPEAGRDLHASALALTGKEPDYVLMSHYHKDHIRGSQAFAEAMAVSTTRTRRLIATLGQDELEADRENAPERVETMKAFAQSRDPEKVSQATLFLPYWQGILATSPETKLRLPELTFRNQLTFHGNQRSAVLIETSWGHTESDCMLLLPQDGIVFCGDLLFVRGHPYLGDGDPESLLSILAKLKNLKTRTYVPGHGPAGNKEDLDKMALYIRTLIEQTHNVLAKGGTEEDATMEPVPEPFADWILAQPFYEFNKRFLYGRLTRPSAK